MLWPRKPFDVYLMPTYIASTTNNLFNQISGIYFDVRGPTIDPTNMPKSSTPIRGQYTTTPLSTINENILTAIPTSTVSAEVPATRNMGSPAILVRKGTNRNPPPIPRKDASAAIKKPPTRGMAGLKLNSTP